MTKGMAWSKWKTISSGMLQIIKARPVYQVWIACFVLLFVPVIHVRLRFTTQPVTPKTILWYYPPRYIPKNMSGLVPLDACPGRNCFMTGNRYFLPQSDAVIFSAEHINERVLPIRRPGQVWIFHNNEPPYLFASGRPFHKGPWSSSFNWTMDFRHDSDIVRPYAILRKKSTVPNRNYGDIVKKKSKLVAMMISNCQNWSGRLPYALELDKTIPVDIYGECGKQLFSRENHIEWMQFLNKTYKFYLAFENLYCLDYISEKFFNNFNLDLVTIARGGGNYTRDVPPKTFINVADFKSPKELGKYLLYLDKHPAEYISILKEKDKYIYENEEYKYIDATNRVYLEHYFEKKPLCELCERLRDLKTYSKTIPDIVPWFKKGICKERGI